MYSNEMSLAGFAEADKNAETADALLSVKSAAKVRFPSQ